MKVRSYIAGVRVREAAKTVSGYRQRSDLVHELDRALWLIKRHQGVLGRAYPVASGPGFMTVWMPTAEVEGGSIEIGLSYRAGRALLALET